MIPVVICYNKKEYTDKSPFLLETNGAYGGNHDLKFDHWKLSLLDWGIVLAYPMLRGTQYLNKQWYLKGTNDWKSDHILDFVDVSKFLWSKITNSLGIYSEVPSGGLTALASILLQPGLYDAAVVLNPITNLPDYCFWHS